MDSRSSFKNKGQFLCPLPRRREGILFRGGILFLVCMSVILSVCPKTLRSKYGTLSQNMEILFQSGAVGDIVFLTTTSLVFSSPVTK